MKWMLMSYRRYADFSGRSQRMEYWMFYLLYAIVAIVCLGLIIAEAPNKELDPGANGGPIFWLGATVLGLWVLGSIVPSIAVTVRRFHDQDKSGWMYLLTFVPYVGGLIIFAFMCMEGTRGPNSYGADPKDPHTADIFS
ncbi:MAG: DUF805 domain-containing protein [Novosphingobium sp.]